MNALLTHWLCRWRDKSNLTGVQFDSLCWIDSNRFDSNRIFPALLLSFAVMLTTYWAQSARRSQLWFSNFLFCFALCQTLTSLERYLVFMIITTRKYGCGNASRFAVTLCRCTSVCGPTVESLELEMLFVLWRYIFWTCRLNSYIKVIG